MKKRVEKDSLGEIEVASDVYWGAQTERSLHYFAIGNNLTPYEVIGAIVLIKQMAAEVNCELKLLPKEKRDLIVFAAKRILAGEYSDQFPLKVWQTGSGTQSNMNVNEVIANIAIKKARGVVGSKKPIHPVDDVNMSQSSNDVFPTAMHIAAASALLAKLLPQAKQLHAALLAKSKEFAKVIKVGRTHLMDAAPLTMGAEFSGYAAQVATGIGRIEATLPYLYELAIGATAVGSGLNAPKDFGEKMAHKIALATKIPFASAPNKYAALASHEPLVAAHAMIKSLAGSLIKIATDLSWMVSGPCCGLGELSFPANEPGSSIMAGKVNPTQCEAMIMVCTQIFGHDTAISIAGSRGNFELNVLKPLIIYDFLESVTLLTDAMQSFTEAFLLGVQPRLKNLSKMLEHNYMLATALVPKLGYDLVAKIVAKAQSQGIALKKATLALSDLSAKEYDKIVDPKKMV